MLVRKKDGYEPFTLGNFMDCGTEYIVYDGSDYIGFSKEKYELKEKKENNIK